MKPLVAAEVVFIGLVGECLESFTFERRSGPSAKSSRFARGAAGCLRTARSPCVDHELKSRRGRGQSRGARAGRCVVREGRSCRRYQRLTGEPLPRDTERATEVLAGSLTSSAR